MREAGLVVNDKAKIYCNPASNEDHSIIDPEGTLCISLRLDGVFSYFDTRKPTKEDLRRDHIECVYLSPVIWDPSSNYYRHNEDCLVDMEGEVVPVKGYHKSVEKPFLVCEDEDTYHINHILTERLKLEIERVSRGSEWLMDEEIQQIGEVSKSYIGINPNVPSNIEKGPIEQFLEPNDIHIDTVEFSRSVTEYGAEQIFKMSVGSGSKLCSNDIVGNSSFVELAYTEIDATILKKARGATVDDLVKIWRIDQEAAKRTLDCTTQLKKEDVNGDISRRFSTNDRMLPYQRINQHFFTDTFEAKDQYKSTRGYRYCQLFVSDKGKIFIVLMRKKSEFYSALQLFAKEIGVPLLLISDPSGEQLSNDVRQFARECQLKLKLVEESTQWANLAERYIGILKSAVCKDMYESDCPLVLWDYCIEWT